jgi:hypothetical protein
MRPDTLKKKLITELQEGRVTIIVGTGISVAATENQEIEGCKVATWPGLLLHGVQHCKEIGLVDDFDVSVLTLQINSGRTDHIISAAETITNKMRARSAGVYRGWLKSTIGALQVANPAPIEALNCLPGVIATLNYDNVIEDVTNRRAVTWLKTDEVEEVLNGRYEDSVIHLHGWYREPESVVLGASSYLNVKNHSHAKSVLQHFTIGRTLLFVGCGSTFEDPNFSQLIQWARDAISDVSPRHYVLCCSSELVRFQSKLEDAPWLQPLSYGDTHSSLTPFLQSLVSTKIVKKKKSSPLNLELDAYRKAMLTRYNRLKIEQLDPTTHDIRPLTLNALYIDQYAKECTAIVPRVFELPKEMQHQLRRKGELEGTEFDDATLAQYRRAYLDGAPRLISEILTDPMCLKLVILGDPGSGKSTLLQHVILQWSEASPVDVKSQRLPLLIELRDFAHFTKENKSSGFLEYLEQAAGMRWHLEQNALKNWLLEKNSIFLFDGLDEIFDLAQRREITTAIHRFAHEYPLAQIIVTSRVVGYQHQAWNDEGFRQFMLQDLDQDKIETFLQRWHKAAYEAADDGEKKRLLLESAIKDSAAIRQLAGNPLLLTMMAVLNRTQDLPRDRAELYEQCARLLLHQWKVDVAFQTDPDLANASLDFKDKRGLLLRVARAMHSGEKGLAGNLVDEETLESTLAAGLNEIRVSLPTRAARSLIDQLRGRNFMLCFMGGHTYAFVHRTFLEYFCALEIRERFEKERSLSIDQLENEIFGHWEDETWHEVLCLLAGMISAKFAEQTIQWLMTQPDPNSTRHHIFLALRCLSEIRNRTMTGQTEIQLRRIAKNLSIFQPPFPAPPWTVEGQEVSELRTRALRLISAVWPDMEDNCRWFKHVALSDDSWDVPEVAVRLLSQGCRDDEETFIWLKKQITAKGRNHARIGAINELVRGWKSHPETPSIIHSAFNEIHDDSIRATALEAIVELEGESNKIFDFLIKTAQSDKNYYVAYVAVQTLVDRWSDHPEVFVTLMSMARAESSLARHLSLQTLMRGWAQHSEVISLVQDVLGGEQDSSVLSLAYRVVFESWDDRDFAINIAKRVALGAGERHIRQSAIDLIVEERLETPEALEVVMECATATSTTEVRAHAVRKLASWPKNPSVFDFLKGLVFSRQAWTVRRAALQAMVKGWGTLDEVESILTNVLNEDKSAEVRKSAVEEILNTRVKKERKLMLLKDIILDGRAYASVRAAAVSGVSQFSDIDGEIYSLIKNSLATDKPTELRISALRVLISNFSAHSESLAILQRIATKDKSADARLAAVAELSRRSSEDSNIIQILKKIVREDRNKAVRLRLVKELARGWPEDADVLKLIEERGQQDPNKEIRATATIELSEMSLLL